MIKKKFLIYGWFGENNYGDELLLKSAINLITEATCNNAEINVVGANPKIILKNHSSVHRASVALDKTLKKYVKSFVLDPKSIFNSYSNNDILIIAGGGAISDWNDISTREMFYLINCFSKKNKPIFLFGVGAGPIIHKESYEPFRRVLSKAQFITTRDKYSNNELLKIGLKNVFESKDLSYYSGIYNEINMKDHTIKNIGIAIAPVCLNTPSVYDKFVDEMIKAINILCKDYIVSLIPFQYLYDKKLYDCLIDKCKNAIVLCEPDNIWSVEKFISKQDLIIGMRYHSLLLSTMLGKYTIPIIYHPKCASFCQDYSIEKYAESIGNGENWKSSNINHQRIIDNIDIIKNDNSYFDRIKSVINNKRETSLEFDIIRSSFKRG